MSQNPLSVMGRTLGHTPFGIFAGFQVLDSDLFFGLLFLALHVSYLILDGFDAASRAFKHDGIADVTL